MSVIQIVITDDNEFNLGWLKYLLGLDRPEVIPADESGVGGSGVAANGWDMAKESRSIDPIRRVFTRQNALDKPQYVVSEVTPSARPSEKPKAVVVGE